MHNFHLFTNIEVANKGKHSLLLERRKETHIHVAWVTCLDVDFALSSNHEDAQIDDISFLSVAHHEQVFRNNMFSFNSYCYV